MDDALDPRRWRALGACVTALFMALLDVSIVNVALPSIGRGLLARPPELQWVVSGYALAFGMVAILGGRLGDDRGRRLMLLVGIGSFVACSACVGLAPTAELLVAARVLQGLSGGLLSPQVSGLVQQLFPPAERPRAFGLIGTVVGLATAAGPVLGGAVIALGGSTYGWRLCFLTNVPVGIASYLLCRRFLPLVPSRASTRRLDLPGLALLTFGMFGLLFPVVEYDAEHDLRLVLLVLPATALLLGFVAWERGPARRRGHPLIDLTLFQIRSYAHGVALAALCFSALTGPPLVLALFLQNGLGLSPLQSGLAASPYAVGTAVSAFVGGRLVLRLGARLLVGALVLFTAATAAAALVADAAASTMAPGGVALLLAGPLLFVGLGGGSVVTPNQALTLADVGARGGSTAGAVLQTSQRLGNALGAAVITAVFYAASSGASADQTLRRQDYGQAFALSLAVSGVLALAALLLVRRYMRRGPDGAHPAAESA